ncbi:MAG: hypothetical protein IH969_04045, partial [Candidatus Krumholzibacteriota bacterium]|nr:hypothetical protein [Candidatus Krumholzibacteriota bacterium]
MTKLDVHNRARRIFDPFVTALAAIGVPPILVSLSGLALSLYGASVVADGGHDLNALLSSKHYIRARVLEADLAEFSEAPFAIVKDEKRE